MDLHDVGGATLADLLGPARFDALHSHTKTGVDLLNSWARGEEQGAFVLIEMLHFLTTGHRRASPPNVSEQPRMSLGARRDYHAFLTTPVLPGLYGLGNGSLLQTFALTIGISRIAEDPVTRAIEV
jgi:hypothetical protein